MTGHSLTTIGDELRSRLRGDVREPGDEGYDAARAIWNAAAVDRRPALVARCRDAADVRTALLAAREHGLPLSVRGGGHDWAGRALCEGGVVLDLSGMRDVRVDGPAAVADVQGGVRIADLAAPAADAGLATSSGVVGDVGLVGLTLAGGYGPLAGRCGLALDNLVSADVVLADGRQVTAGEGDGEDPELLWALRGGGGNFGVVTAARYRLHALAGVVGGMVMYPFEQAAQVLAGYRDLIATAPDELTVMAGFLTGPDGGPVVFVAPTWSGPLEAGEAAVAPLKRLGTPLMDGVRPMRYPDLLRQFDDGIVVGNRNALGTRWLGDLGDDAIAALVDGAATLTSPGSLLALHQFHGAAARVAPDATAFALRRDHLLAEVIGSWAPGPDDAPHRRWVRRVADALAPGALPGGYPNILGPEDADRVRLGYGANAERLVAAKRRYDPDGVLTAVGAIG